MNIFNFKMNKIIRALIIIFLMFCNELKANENLFEKLREGGKIIFIRHAYAPGNGDPEKFTLYKCSTQRNLNSDGVKQSKKIGMLFIKNNIKIDQILSSEWCRCKDTSRLAFQKYKTFSALNSFYDVKFRKNKDKQIKELKNYINNWSSNRNLVLVTHQVVILEILKQSVVSGEIIVSDKNFKILGNIKTNN